MIIHQDRSPQRHRDTEKKKSIKKHEVQLTNRVTSHKGVRQEELSTVEHEEARFSLCLSASVGEDYLRREGACGAGGLPL